MKRQSMSRTIIGNSVLWSGMSLLMSVAAVPVILAAEPVDFERDVASMLIDRCIECHHRGKASGGLNLSVAEGLQRGGDSGPAVDLDKPAEGHLIRRVAAGEMLLL